MAALTPPVPRRKDRLWVSTAASAALIVAFFAACETVDRTWLTDSGPAAHTILRLIQGIGTAFLIAALLALHLFRRQGSPFQAPDRPFLMMQTLPDEVSNVRNYSLWFCSLRWIATVSALGLTAVCCYAVDVLPRAAFVPLATIIILLMAFNALLVRATRRTPRPYRLLMAQAVVDLALLSALIAFSGALENPLFTLYILHVIIASILLERKDAFRVLALSCSLLITVAVLQALQILPFQHILLFPLDMSHRPVFAFGVALPYTFILVATGYILSMVKEQLNRTAEERRQAYEQLIRQEKMVVLGEVAAGVAHEINNPLHGVQSCLAMLKKTNQGLASDAEFVPLMEEGLDRIALITRRLLLHSRHATLSMRETSLNEVVDESVKFIEYRARQQDTQLLRRLDPSIPNVSADAKSLSEVVINLLVNALDALEKGGTIEIVTAPSKAGPGRVELAIRDTGCGIPAENLELIFHPFFTTKAVGKGSGLGLSISKKIVDDHKGTLRVESEVGKGSRFIIELPGYGTAPAGEAAS